MILINAIIFSLFKESLRSYLLRCWEIVTGKRNTSFVHEPFLHVCVSHFMKNAKRLVRKTWVLWKRFLTATIGFRVLYKYFSFQRYLTGLSEISGFGCTLLEGAELGDARGANTPPKFCLVPPVDPKILRVTSCHCIEVLHRPLTTPLVAKLAPPVPPPNENVWLRPWLLVRR